MTKEERIKAANRYSAQYLIHSLEEVANKAFIKGAEAEAESKWISVRDRLPKSPDIVYLVCVKNKNKEGGIPLIDVAVFDSDGIWQKSTVWEDVTHWMELPSFPTP